MKPDAIIIHEQHGPRLSQSEWNYMSITSADSGPLSIEHFRRTFLPGPLAHEVGC